MGRVLLGTSGWSYPEWVGVFYPTATESKLKHYTRVFPTAEIDSTFYAFPQAGVVQGWERHSPKDFVFAAKLPQTITHEKLKSLGTDIERELDRFAELMIPLNNSGKLGCFLIQLPPSYKYNIGHLDQFFALLPHGFNYAIEFRHKSWLQAPTWKTLEKYNVAYTIVDEPLLPPEMHITADFAYLRWHGRGQRPWYNYHYTEKELEEWIPKVEEARASTKNLYGYFNNHFHGYAVENSLRVLEILGDLTTDQKEALERAKGHLGHKERDPNFGLSRWLKQGESQGKMLEELRELMGQQRFERAITIPEEEVSVQKADDSIVEAKVRDYRISMNLKTRTILHDCGDWERSVETRQLCKHVGRVLLSIPEPVANEWISSIRSDVEAWSFKTLRTSQ